MSTFKINKGVVDNLESSLSGKSSTDLDNLSQTGEAHFANPALTNSPYTTNRILEIPQDIKLELNDGVLTLKAGSKVYVPNGFEEDGTTPKFDVVVVESDITVTSSYTSVPRFLLRLDNGVWDISPISACFSGTTAPTVPSGGIAFWYDTSNNLIKMTRDSGSTWTPGLPLPLAIVHTDETQIVSIDQVFNGFSYIGSTVFALPGVKGLAPNGRDANGTCLTQVKENTTVRVFHSTVIRSGITRLLLGDEAQFLTAYEYDDKNNRIRNTLGNFDVSGVFAAAIFTTDSSSPYRITSFTPFTVDSIANSNASNFSQAGRSYLSGIGMPSSRYIDLTLGASGSSYTAPANGYFALWSVSNSYDNTRYICIHKLGQNKVGSSLAYETIIQPNYQMPLVAPVKKGEIIHIIYSIGAVMFRFYYAEGEIDV